MIMINLKNRLNGEQEQWLAKNVGPRMHYLHNSVGGQGWISRYDWTAGLVTRQWTLTFEDDRYATYFSLMFPQ